MELRAEEERGFGPPPPLQDKNENEKENKGNNEKENEDKMLLGTRKRDADEATTSGEKKPAANPSSAFSPRSHHRQQEQDPRGDSRRKQADVVFSANQCSSKTTTARATTKKKEEEVRRHRDSCPAAARQGSGRASASGGGHHNPRSSSSVYIASLGCRRPYPTCCDLYYSSDKSDSDDLPEPALSLLSSSNQSARTTEQCRKRLGQDQAQAHNKSSKLMRTATAGAGAGTVAVAATLECLSEELLHKIVCHLDPKSVSSMRCTNRHFRQIVDREDGQVWREAMRNYCGDPCASHLCEKYLGKSPKGTSACGEARDLARKLVTLENLRWTKRTVGGKVEPTRCNFSSCAVGQKIVIFGGDHGQHALNDTYVLDLTEDRRDLTPSKSPGWKRLHMRRSPPGRFGHTIRALNDHMCVLFGGCGNNGLFNDCYLLDLNDKEPQWRQVVTHPKPAGEGPMMEAEEADDYLLGGRDYLQGGARAGEAPGEVNVPVERVWHAACMVQQSKLVVFGGCDNVGKLLDDMHILDLSPLLSSKGSREAGADGSKRGTPPSSGSSRPPTIQQHAEVAPEQQHQEGQQHRQQPPVQGVTSPDWREVAPPSQGPGVLKPSKGKKPALVDQLQLDNTAATTRVAAMRTTQHQEGEAEAGTLLRWRKVETGSGFKPPARIGHSLVVLQEEGTKVMVFGGIANVGPVRARDNSAFVIDIAAKEPKWVPVGRTPEAQHRNKQVSGAAPHQHHREHSRGRHGSSNLPLPSPRLDHVCWKLPGDRQIVFGGSASVFGKGSQSDHRGMFLLNGEAQDQGKLTASWTKIETSQAGCEGPQSAWNHCACVMDHGMKCVVLGGSKGQDWLVNELHELSIM
ncbi:adagio-like protein [Chloropicon primus]|uniref:F-box domain-containing protein n=2 Tax=Chloropicon primus TaxID=1764295 RepID=A0A5B8MX49_9CHLO|nr:hypothetical protein A3770_12p67730 [Chloropicon primus]UPR03462.1 adagio-like protein [Chloropicon primus]|eukprot:QDZ24255.1 hypothetical protein A3770_12p67730 [Chloropicon primus]